MPSRTYLSAVLGAVCLASLCYSGPLNAQDVLVMQYNIEKALGKISYNTNEQAKALGRIVNYLQPDVILLNELQTTIVFSNELALVDWVTNNLPYMGTQKNVSFFLSVSDQTDNFNRNAAISLYPISNAVTYDDDLRGLHSFRIEFPGTNQVQFFHTHLKSGNSTNSVPTDAERRQAEAQFDADTISAWASSNSIPYVFTGDLNVDESYSQTPTNETYHPVTTILTAGLSDYEPTDLNGNSKTISSAQVMATRRYDYILSNTNRLAPVTGFVFNASVWSQHGMYTNVPGNFPTDNIVASDHYPVLVTYHFASQPAILDVTPTNGFSSVGNQGGPFSPSNAIYTVANVGDQPLSWTASVAQAWISLSPAGGTLQPQSSIPVTLSLNANANGLFTGTHEASVAFSNLVNGDGDTSRDVMLAVTSNVPTVIVDATDAVAKEPGTNTGKFVVSRLGSTNAPLRADYALSGTATPGIDYSNIP